MAEDLNQLLKVRREKLAALQEAGKDPFVITKCDVTHHSLEIKDRFEEMEGKTVTVAGRMMFKRVMGKASFCNLRDLQGDIQAYVARDNIGEDDYKDFKKYDKIEKSGKIFNEVIYYERVESTIEMTESEGVNLVLDTLEKSLSKDLKRDGKIIDKIVTKERVDDEYLNVKVVFVVEQNIVSDEVVEY